MEITNADINREFITESGYIFKVKNIVNNRENLDPYVVIAINDEESIRLTTDGYFNLDYDVTHPFDFKKWLD